MQKKAIATLRQIIGWVFVIVGVLGLALPLLQGVILVVIGLYILSLDSAWFRKKLKGWARKDVRVARTFERVDRNIRNLFGMDHDSH